MARSVLTLPEAAKFLGVPPEELSLLRESGALPAQKRSGEWVFDRGDLERVADAYLRPEPSRTKTKAPPAVSDESDEDSDHALLGGALEATPVEVTPQPQDSGLLWEPLSGDQIQEASSMAKPILDGLPTDSGPRNGRAGSAGMPPIFEGRLAPDGENSPPPPGHDAPRDGSDDDDEELSFAGLHEVSDEVRPATQPATSDDSGMMDFTEPDSNEPDSEDLAPATEEEVSREDSLILDGVPLLGEGAGVPSPSAPHKGLSPFEAGDFDEMFGSEENRWAGPPSSSMNTSNVFEDGPVPPQPHNPSVEFPSLSFDEHELGGASFFSSGTPRARLGNPDAGAPAAPEDFPSLSFDEHEPSRARIESPFGQMEFAPAQEGSALPPPNRPIDEASHSMMSWADDDDGTLDRILGDASDEFASSASTEQHAPHDPFADLLSGDELELESAEPPSADDMPLSTGPSGPSGSGAFAHLDTADNTEDFANLDLDSPLWQAGEGAATAPSPHSGFGEFSGPDDPPGAISDNEPNFGIDPHEGIHATDVEFSEIDLDAPGATVVVPGNTRMIEELREHAARTRRDEREYSSVDFGVVNHGPGIPVSTGDMALPADDEDDTVQIETFDVDDGDDQRTALADLRGRSTDDQRAVYDPASTDSPWIDPDPSDTSIQPGPRGEPDSSPFDELGTSPTLTSGAGWGEPTHVELASATDETSHVFDGEFGRSKQDDDPPTLESQLSSSSREPQSGDAFSDGPLSTDEPSLPPFLLPPRSPSDSDEAMYSLDDADDSAEVLSGPEPGAPQAPTLIGMGGDFQGAVRMTTEEERQLSDSKIMSSNAPTMIGRSSGEFDALGDLNNVGQGYSDSSLMAGPSLIGPSNMGAPDAYDSVGLNSTGDMALDDDEPNSAEELSEFRTTSAPRDDDGILREFVPPSGQEELDDSTSSVFEEMRDNKSALAESLSDEFVMSPSFSANTVYFDPFRESPSVEFLNDIDLSALTTDVVELPSPSRLQQQRPTVPSGIENKPAGLSGIQDKPVFEALTAIEQPASTQPVGQSGAAAAAAALSGPLPPVAEDSSFGLDRTPVHESDVPAGPGSSSSVWSSAESDLDLKNALQSAPDLSASLEPSQSMSSMSAMSSMNVETTPTPSTMAAGVGHDLPDLLATPGVGESSGDDSDSIMPEPKPQPVRRLPPLTPPGTAAMTEASSLALAGHTLSTGFARSPLTSSRVAVDHVETTTGDRDAEALEEETATAAAATAASKSSVDPWAVTPRPLAAAAPTVSPAASPAEREAATGSDWFAGLMLGATVAVMVVVGFMFGVLLTGLLPSANPQATSPFPDNSPVSSVLRAIWPSAPAASGQPTATEAPAPPAPDAPAPESTASDAPASSTPASEAPASNAQPGEAPAAVESAAPATGDAPQADPPAVETPAPAAADGPQLNVEAPPAPAVAP